VRGHRARDPQLNPVHPVSPLLRGNRGGRKARPAARVPAIRFRAAATREGAAANTVCYIGKKPGNRLRRFIVAAAAK